MSKTYYPYLWAVTCKNMRDFEKYAKSHVPHSNSALGPAKKWSPGTGLYPAPAPVDHCCP